MTKANTAPASQPALYAPRLAILHSKKFRVHFTRNSHFTRAILTGDDSCFGQGRTENEALGDMVSSHAEKFGFFILSRKKV